MKQLIITLAFVCFSNLFLNAQGIEDMVRFSQGGLFGSPRFVATGGAFGALGNDFSAIHVNPAGASVFRNSEVGIAFNLQNIVSEGSYYGDNNRGDAANFSVPVIGLVSVTEKKNKRSAFAITVNQMANFRQYNNIQTSNATYSLANSFADVNRGISLNEISDIAFEAYQQGLIDNPLGNSEYESPIQYDRLETSSIIESRGSRSEIGFTYSQSIKNKLHWGASVNFINHNFFQTTLHLESGFTNPITNGATSINYREELNQTGFGLNVRAGVIYKITQQLRVGLSGTTPSFISMNEEYSDGLNGFISDIFFSSYEVGTPANITASAAYILNKFGFISVDYMFTNFGAARFGRSSFDEFGGLRGLNEFIREDLTNVHTLRIGAESKIKNFFLRAGYNYSSSPYSDFPNDGAVQVISGGFGYRLAKFEINATVASAVSDVELRPFQLSDPAFQTISRTSFLVGMAYRFN